MKLQIKDILETVSTMNDVRFVVHRKDKDADIVKVPMYDPVSNEGKGNWREWKDAIVYAVANYGEIEVIQIVANTMCNITILIKE